MLPVHFEEANHKFTKPDGWKDEDCMDISAMTGTSEDGLPYIVTKWMPSVEDLQALNEGRGLYVKIVSKTFAPMSIMTLDADGKVN